VKARPRTARPKTAAGTGRPVEMLGALTELAAPAGWLALLHVIWGPGQPGAITSHHS
jgi:hypothetical protein